MKFDLTQNSTGEWFPFFGSETKADGTVNYLPPEKDAGKVQIRLADTETVERIQKETRSKVKEWLWHPKTHQPYRGEAWEQSPEQQKKEREMIWDHAIQSWEGILDKDGNAIPCTTENKVKLMSIPMFARFVGRCLELLNLSEAERKAALEKNS